VTGRPQCHWVTELQKGIAFVTQGSFTDEAIAQSTQCRMTGFKVENNLEIDGKETGVETSMNIHS
jgi:hypothetical protein